MQPGRALGRPPNRPCMNLAGDDSGVVRLWDTRQSDAVASWEPHSDFVSDLALHEREDCLLSVSGDGTLAVIDLRTRKVRGSFGSRHFLRGTARPKGNGAEAKVCRLSREMRACATGGRAQFGCCRGGAEQKGQGGSSWTCGQPASQVTALLRPPVVLISLSPRQPAAEPLLPRGKAAQS